MGINGETGSDRNIKATDGRWGEADARVSMNGSDLHNRAQPRSVNRTGHGSLKVLGGSRACQNRAHGTAIGCAGDSINNQ